MKNKTVFNFDFWRYLINAWSVLFWWFIIYDFLVGNAFIETLDVISIVYIGALAVYVSNKEFERWYNHHQRQHPGEIFVVIWTVLMFLIISSNMILKSSYHLPASVISSYIAVLTMLAVTRKSKVTYGQIHKR